MRFLATSMLLFYALKLLNVDRLLNLLAVFNRWLSKILATPKFFKNSSLLKLSLKLFKSLFNVFSFFNWNDYHGYSFCFRAAKL